MGGVEKGGHTLRFGAGSFGRGAEQFPPISMKWWASGGWILLNSVLIGYRGYKPLQLGGQGLQVFLRTNSRAGLGASDSCRHCSRVCEVRAGYGTRL